MNRLALAKTIVTGTVTLQGMGYSFAASGSGTAKADKVPEAKKLAVAASNTAAISAARASIDKILSDNSAVLSDLEITSLISNNFKTTVRVFKPISLESVATTTDGINYTLNKNVTIGTGQWLTVPNGKNLTSTGKVTNRGYFQLGEGQSNFGNKLKTKITGDYTLSYCFDNKQGEYHVTDTGNLTISSGGKLVNGSLANLQIDSGGIVTNGGYITNNSGSAYVYNNGTINNNKVMTNYVDACYISNYGILNNPDPGCISNYSSKSMYHGTAPIGNQVMDNGTLCDGGKITCN